MNNEFQVRHKPAILIMEYRDFIIRGCEARTLTVANDEPLKIFEIKTVGKFMDLLETQTQSYIGYIELRNSKYKSII